MGIAQQVRIAPLPFDAVADSMNTVDERGQVLCLKHALVVDGLDDGQVVDLQFPAIEGRQRRDLLVMRWDDEGRCWRSPRGQRTGKSRDREEHALRTVIRASGTYGLFVAARDGRGQRLKFKGLPGVEWRLVVRNWGVVVEGKGDADLALEPLPAQALLSVRPTPQAPLTTQTLWHWCGIRNRRVGRAYNTYRIHLKPSIPVP
jgi:hypothetical protein